MRAAPAMSRRDGGGASTSGRSSRDSLPSARGRALLLLGAAGGGEVLLRQRPDDHDLVVLDRDLHPRKPAVREPSCKPTLDRTELFVIHEWHDRHYMITLQQPLSRVRERSAAHRAAG